MNEVIQNYKGYQILQARIIAVRANELIVSLPDRKKGYIPRKEWSWEKSLHKKEKKFKEGENIKVVVVPRTDSIRLSIKELTDPWQNINQYRVNQISLGVVIQIRASAVYVELEAGIVGKLPIEHIPVPIGKKPSELLSIGDKVKVEITKLDLQLRRMELNLISPLQRSIAKELLAAELQKLFQPGLEQLQDEVGTLFSNPIKPNSSEVYFTTPLGELKNVLVVDNEVNDGEGVSRLLETQLNVKTLWVSSQKEALEAVKAATQPFDLAVIDINLSNEEIGVEVAKKMLKIQPDLPCIFMSKSPLSESYLLSLETELKRPFPFATKEWDLRPNPESAKDLLNTIQLRQEGKIIKNPSYSAIQEGHFVNALEQTSTLNLTLSEKLGQLLQELVSETKIDHALILQLNNEQEKVEIAAAYPRNNTRVYDRNMDGLYYSPVFDVIEEGEIFYLSEIDVNNPSPRLKNFFKELSFQTCYGIPIKLSGQLSEYGLFVLDKRSDLIWSIISRIRLTASFAGLIIEKDKFLNQLRPMQDMILKGELMNTFLHELNIKLRPIMDLAEEGIEFIKEGKKQEFWDFFQELAPDLKKIKQLATAYGRLAKQEMEEVDLNAVVEKVQHQLAPYAQKLGGIKLEIHTKELPPVHAISLQVEQVLANVVLNAIQHIGEQNKSRRNFNDEIKGPASRQLREHSMVLINTCTSPNQDACCIVVIDSGPGVPYPKREKIFHLGESDREGGHGLGLYISRSLMEAMHGRLLWVDSVRLWGSAFAIIFPLNK